MTGHLVDRGYALKLHQQRTTMARSNAMSSQDERLPYVCRRMMHSTGCHVTYVCWRHFLR
jgi:hypothetical protein